MNDKMSFGKVKISASGSEINRLLNILIYNKVNVKIISKSQNEIIFITDIKNVKIIIKYSKKYKIKIRIIEKKGIYFILKKLSIFNLLALLFVAIVFYILNSFIFDVKIIAPSENIEKQVETQLNSLGIKPFIFKKSIDINDLKNRILLNNQNIFWINTKIYGSILIIEIVERNNQNITNKKGTKIIASRDGIITKIILRSGTAVVKEGDTVIKGQLLVHNQEVLRDNTTYELPKVDADIYANTWYEYKKQYIHNEFKKEPTKYSYIPVIQVNKKMFSTFFLLPKHKKYDKIIVKEKKIKIFNMLIGLYIVKIQNFKYIKNNLNTDNVIKLLEDSCNKEFYKDTINRNIIEITKIIKNGKIYKKAGKIYMIELIQRYQCVENISLYQ
ncbi:sporulation protein YqfD [Caldicellulosiruptoraceae bacterium PP1]